MARATRKFNLDTPTGIEPVADAAGGNGGADSSNSDTGVSGNPVIDPAAIDAAGDTGGGGSGDANSTGKPKRKYTRRNSAGNTKASPLNINGVENILYSMHMMLSGITKTPELLLDKAEANAMAIAMAEVSKHYDVAVAQKSLDWANLLMVVGGIYGTRLVAIRMRNSREKELRKKNPATGMPVDTNGLSAAPFMHGIQ